MRCAGFLTSFVLLITLVNGVAQYRKNDVGRNDYGVTTSTQFYSTPQPTSISAVPTFSYPASNPYNSSMSPVSSPSIDYKSYTYIYTYPSPLQYISKITITNFVA